MAEQISKGKTSEQAFNDLCLARSYWKSKILNMIRDQPNLSYVEIYGPNGEVGLSIRITNSFQQKEPMGLDDLKVVHKAMQDDLSNIIDWNQSTNLYPTSTPFQF